MNHTVLPLLASETTGTVARAAYDFKGSVDKTASSLIQQLEFVELEAEPKAASAPITDIENDVDNFKDIETVALVVDQAKADFELQPVILDEVRGGEVLIEMRYSGICHTDIVLQQGLLPLCDFPAIFGHEGAGIIRAIGKDVKDKSLRVGDAALLSFNTCGTCRPCTTGHPAYCHTHPQVNHNGVRISDRSTPARRPNGQAVRSQYFGQSSFAKMSVVNEKCVVRCPNPENMKVYAPMGCGFQTGAGTVLNVLKPMREESIVVFGLGSVGLAALMAAKYLDVGQIITVDIVDAKLDLARELGATHTINSRARPDTAAAIKEITGGSGANYAIDCTGILAVIEGMIEAIGPLGTAAMVGVPPAGAKIQIDPLAFLLENKKFIGVIEGDSNPVEFIPELIRMHQEGKFPVEKLCRTYPVAKLSEAIQDMHAGKVIKPVIEW